MTAGESPARSPFELHLVPHTHWDREWYEPFQRFRLRLVDLVDAVLEQAEADPRFRFTFDGQTAMLDDYLEIRPEAEPRLRALVVAGQLAVGPWRILADEFLVAGETLIRNLEAGLQRAARLGGAMPIGYLPDQFGHAAQLPQLLRRAGMEHAVVWRGVPAAVDRHAFRWSSPDGSTVRAEYLLGGYGNAAGLFGFPDDLKGTVGRLHERLRPVFGADPVLAMYGTDHGSPLPELLELVDAINGAQDRVRVRVGTLADYLAAAGGGELPVWRGELRSAARANLLPGVISARIGLKAACARAERLLARYAEPLQALHGGSWPAPFLELAWRRLVESSGHDSITGCGADATAAQVAVRLAEAAQLGAALAERAAAEVARRVPREAAAVLNPSPFPRAGLVELDLPVPDAWREVALELPDGRLLATQETGRSPALVHTEELPAGRLAEVFRRVHDRELYGRVVNGVRVEEAGGMLRLTFEVDDHADPPHLDMDRLRREVELATLAAGERLQLRIVAPPRRRLLASVPVPPLGWTAVTPRPGRSEVTARPGRGEVSDPVAARPGRGEVAAPVTAHGGARSGAAPPVPARRGPRANAGAPAAVRRHRLENGLLAVEVADDGSLRLRGAGVAVDGVGRLVDGGDTGDLYNYAPPAADRLVAEPDTVAVAVAVAGPLRGELVVERSYRWPLGLDAAGTARSAELATIPTVTRVELRAGEPFVRLRVEVDNRCRDHRLRLHLPLATAAKSSFAEGQFAVVERGTVAEGGHGERPLATFPARGFVDAGGVAVLLDHVTEYELLTDPPEMALTLLRAVGQMSRNHHRWRDEPAGPELPTPAAQCLGPWTASLAVYPHPGSWHQDHVLEQMERYQHDLLAAPGSRPPRRVGPAGNGPQGSDGKDATSGGETAALEDTGLTVEGEGVMLSALRQRDDWLELRLVCQHPTPVAVTIGGGLTAAREADLLGRPGTSLPLSGATLRLDLAAWEIRTIHLRRERRSS
jgi:Glycosyl hydrolases family 38 N-terminal domain/Glycosyl hydrolases family 38 C-terminal domain/Alpha mannosidase middle domain